MLKTPCCFDLIDTGVPYHMAFLEQLSPGLVEICYNMDFSPLLYRGLIECLGLSIP